MFIWQAINPAFFKKPLETFDPDASVHVETLAPSTAGA